MDCPVAGVFFFIPYILESGILQIVRECHLPYSSVIGAEQAALSMLLLKLIGNERLSHMESYDHEPGLGIFAGLNVLPKATYMGTYSCRTSEEMLMTFQEKLLRRFLRLIPRCTEMDLSIWIFIPSPTLGSSRKWKRCGADLEERP